MDTTRITPTDPPVNAHILIVEDDPTTARYLELSLKRLGCQQVRTAASSQRALDMMRQEQPDLVLMDVDIDGQRDGIETTRLFRNEFDVPVIFLTGYNDEVTMARARQVSPQAYLVKPVKTEELRSAITAALYTHQLANKDPTPVSLSAAVATPAAPQPVDDGELRRLRAELTAISVHDETTGLFNRRGFYLLGEQQLKLARRLDAEMTLLSLTIINAAAIEGEFGAAALLQMRQDVAGMLRNSLPLDLAARFDDDTFVILSGEASSAALASAVKNAIEVHNYVAARAYQLQAQIRVATHSSDFALTMADLLATATEMSNENIEAALREAMSRGSGKNRQRARR